MGWRGWAAATVAACALVTACGEDGDSGNALVGTGGTGVAGAPATGGTGLAPATGASGNAPATGGAEGLSSPAAVAARCQDRCSRLLLCAIGQEAFGTVESCVETCTSLMHAEVPASCEAPFNTLETCRLDAYDACQLPEEVCRPEADVLAECVRAGDECRSEDWLIVPEYTSSGDIHQWACRCHGPIADAGPGEACTSDAECSSICCPCASSATITWGLQACVGGVCAGVDHCATVEAQYSDLCGSAP